MQFPNKYTDCIFDTVQGIAFTLVILMLIY